MDREFAVILNSLTTEGQEKLINTVADFIQATDVIDGLYKEAKMKKKDKRNAVAGGAMVAGGAGLTRNQYHRGHLTGRETLFHNTKKENIDSIKEHGIKASHASDPKNITNSVLGGKVPEKDISNKVYMARKRMIAEQVGMQGNKISPGPRKTLTAKVPTWKMKEVDNPELRGAKNFREFSDALHKENPHIPKPLIQAQTFGAVDALGRKGTATLEGDVSAKYIKGSKHFSRLGKQELKEFIKANPKRFAKGTGKAALGLGAVGLGAHLLRKGLMKKKASEEYKNPVPKASVRYAGGFIAGSALTPWITALLEAVGKNSKINPAVNNLLQTALPAMTNPNTLGLVASVPGILTDISHNTRLKNEDRSKLHDLFDKNASSFIDTLYKRAKMEVPTPQEAEKETVPKKKPKDDRPDIKCENCTFEGKTTPKGECPRCGAIMGVKPSDYPIPYTPIWTGEPMSGISVNEASIRGRMEEAW